jgi:hypothetical protein
MKLYELFLHEEPVLSSWIADLELDNNNVIMTLGNGISYIVKEVGEDIYSKWIAASSKGRFWHEQVKTIYEVKRLA